MSDLKQVKVDNWGIYFLQRLKHFFNRTDYCDLTLQFQDNAQLKVHRLVLSACTEYFELLERTCEMYEDCLVMPEDLQADVVVPIVNFMYTGQLEFKIELLEKLYQTSEIMNMPVLSKLLDAQRQQQPPKPPPMHSYSGLKSYAKNIKQRAPGPSTSSSKRTFTKAFDMDIQRDKHSKVTSGTSNGGAFRPTSPALLENHISMKKFFKGDPRPTRYELPEELDTDNIYENSFTDISYTSTPLMVHPETTKRYSSKRSQFSAPSSSKRFTQGPSTVEIVECRKITKEENVYDDDPLGDEPDLFERDILPSETTVKNSSQLFDQILDSNPGPKVTIEAKNSKQASKLDHAKIISEVLKKYPHLVKSNKNIKLKLLDTPTKPIKKRPATPQKTHKEDLQLKQEPDFTYESEVLDSVRAAKLIAMGAENVKGPWICLICGTPGRALHFTSYFKFRRHLVEVHNEKPVSNMCEYCGLKSLKRNYLLHHLYTKHGKKPPPQYNFPKCNLCSYIALNEGYLVKHKMTHAETRNFRCNVCAAAFNSSSMLLMHIQNTGHKYSAERKTNLQCVYCLKVFLREVNLYAHLKTNHKLEAKTDCIIDDSDEEKQAEEEPVERVEHKPIKYELPVTYEQESEDEATYEIQQKPHNTVDIVDRVKKHRTITSAPRQKILNSGFGAPIQPTVQTSTPQKKPKSQAIQSKILKDLSVPQIDNSHHEEIIMIGETEYIMRDNQLIPKNSKMAENDQYILSDMLHADVDQTLHTLESDTTLEFSNIHNSTEISQSQMKLNKKSTMNQPIQIVVSNEEEYKALMSANHSIIFDDTDTSKRLTVLSASHNAALDGTIDLDSTQTNDMMIIQDDFPLNVSEAVSGDNSNIVVVYSHPVDDHNKPYQLITSQALGGAQFVSTSAVLTRNYETVTTTSGVVNTQIMDSPVNWHNNLEQNIDNQQIQVTQEPELQVLTNVEEVVMTPSHDEIADKLEELPEVHLIPIQSKDESQLNQVPQIEEPLIDSNAQQNNQSEEQTAEIATVQEIPVASSIPMEVDVATQIIQNSDNLVAISTEESVTETMQTESDGIDCQGQEQEQILTEVEVMEKIHNPLEESVSEEQDESVNNVTELTEEISDSQDVATECPVVEQSIINDDPSFTPATNEQIQNLASEWSEDEGETPTQSETITNEGTENEDPEKDNPENNPVELEESIENIQQEMEKQMTRIVTIEPIHECENPMEDMQTEQELQENVTVSNIVPPCPEKITTLLNDWDENDSQDEEETNACITENDGEASSHNEIVAASEHIENNAVPIAEAPSIEDNSAVEVPSTGENPLDEESPKKDDKIKSLVSDWDDDDEDGLKE